MPLWGSDGIARNLAVSSVILSLLVALFAAGGLHRELPAGQISIGDGSPRAAGWLTPLPGQAWLLGLLLGLGAASLVIVTFWLLDALGVSGLSFAGSMALTAFYCGSLGFLVARWVILRQIAGDRGALDRSQQEARDESR